MTCDDFDGFLAGSGPWGHDLRDFVNGAAAAFATTAAVAVQLAGGWYAEAAVSALYGLGWIAGAVLIGRGRPPMHWPVLLAGLAWPLALVRFAGQRWTAPRRMLWGVVRPDFTDRCPDARQGPTDALLAQVGPGWRVRLYRGCPGVWVRVEQRQGDWLVGEVDRRLSDGHVHFRDLSRIAFQLRKVHDPMEPSL